ncbi:Protein of unknown function, DUF547 [Seminavis robusta]|uniref:Uncharacterized protein n=1 Tax=Seminavis robusta TaxID=568900 RepID=A0A9N8EAC0_9STRA|nr:Protein of unknown function, DUF547 [Seminavis robusta]|eukprot:Sro878_g214710.1 Protein of unknown function, DUF547 (493) ;mRNA; f:2735-4213
MSTDESIEQADGTDDGVPSNNDNRAIMVFTRALVRHLSTPSGRLEPTYVGVKRIRPSSRMVKQALDQEKRKETTTQKVSTLVFKVMGEDGQERRMTKQEKKAKKLEIAQQKKLEKEQRRIEKEKNEPPPRKKKRKRRGEKTGPVLAKKPKEEDGQNNNTDSSSANGDSKANNTSAGDTAADNSNQDVKQMDDSNFNNDEIKALSQVGISPPKLSLMEQELADLRGERQGVPPVILSPSLAHVALRTPGFLPGNNIPPKSNVSYVIDDELAQEWATAIQESMLPALEVRGREEMRSMAYAIIPQVWSRMRPDSLMRAPGDQPNNNETKSNSQTVETTTSSHEKNETRQESWGLVPIRPPSGSTFDSDLAAVTEVLYRSSPLYLSCGAKFGCDLLLYDGPRQERHAFGGLRLVVHDDKNATAPFPIPSAYAIAGYVRTLNTAGKLALMALVRRDDTQEDATTFRVALVDLKLQRVDGTKLKGTDERLEKLNRSS